MFPHATASLTRIRAADGKITGAGFLVSERHVLTSTQAVGAVLASANGTKVGTPDGAGGQPGQQPEIRVDFPLLAPGQGLTARVLYWPPAAGRVGGGGGEPADPAAGVAVLELTDDPPRGARSERLVALNDPGGRPFRTLGLANGIGNIVPASGRLLAVDDNGWVSIEDVKQSGCFVEPGFSGSPVWDEQADGVVGMIVAADRHRDTRAAFMIPTAVLTRICPDLARGAVPPCPYRGLLAFREADAPHFFGRAAFIDKLMDALHSRSFVAVLGPSGSGKSSAVFAGLVPRLRADADWLIAPFRPGDHPFTALAAALVPLLEPQGGAADRLREAQPLAAALAEGEVTLPGIAAHILERNRRARRFLLIADQFEEAFTLCRSAEERQRFFDVLLTAHEVAPAAVADGAPRAMTALITLRADFLGQALSSRALAGALEGADLKLGPMSEQELRDVIEKPAEPLGVHLEEGLTDRIVRAVSEHAGGLPLLEFALTELWSRQHNGELTHAAYHEIGGIEKAIAAYAEQVYADLDSTERERVRRVFLQLVRPGESNDDTRRIASRTELREESWDAITRLASARLVTTGHDEATGQDTAEVVHEALIREWGRLRAWLNEDRDFLLWCNRVADARHQWHEHGHIEGCLLRDAPLTVALKWLEERGNEVPEADRVFIQLSRDVRDRQERTKARRRHYTMLGLAAALAVFVALSLVAGLAWNQAEHQKTEAELQRNEAEVQKRVAEQRRDQTLRTQSLFLADLSRQQTEAGNPATGVRLALAALPDPRTDPTRPYVPEAEIALYRALHENRELLVLRGHTGRVWSASFNPQGTRLVTASDDGSPRLWDAATGDLRAELHGHNHAVLVAAFSPDGTRLVTASEDCTARLWDAESGAPGAVLQGHDGGVLAAAFSPDGRRVATASEDGTARLWDAATGDLLTVLTGHAGWVLSATFSPDGRRLVTASYDGTARLWDAATGANLAMLVGHEGAVQAAAFSPDGRRIVTASDDGTAGLWDAATGANLAMLVGHEGAVQAAAFSPDGARLVTVAADGSARLWGAASGTSLARLEGHSGGIRATAFSPDGTRIATASNDGTARLWDTATGESFAVLRGHGSGVRSVAFSPDGARLVTAADDGSARVWDAADTGSLAVLRGHAGAIRAAAFSPTGRRIVTAADDGSVRLWTVEGESLAILRGLQSRSDPLLAAVFQPDEARVIAATAADNGTAQLWNAATGENLAVLRGHENRIRSAAFSRDGMRLVTAADDGTARLWDARTGAALGVLRGHGNWVLSAAFSPDGTRIVTTSADDTARLWDARTGQTLLVLEGHQGWVRSAAFSPDATRIITVSDDGTARLWDAATGAGLRVLRGHGAIVLSAAFSPDGTRVATTANDGTARLWDAAGGETLAVLAGHKGPARVLAFDREGSLLLTASDDGTVRVWRLLPAGQALIEYAHATVRQGLTSEERRQFFLAAH